MTWNIFITDLLLSISALVSSAITYEFYKTVNGTLRKIMIGYFVTQSLMLISTAIGLWFIDTYNLVRIAAIIPWLISMYILWKYLINQGKKK